MLEQILSYTNSNEMLSSFTFFESISRHPAVSQKYRFRWNNLIINLSMNYGGDRGGGGGHPMRASKKSTLNVLFSLISKIAFGHYKGYLFTLTQFDFFGFLNWI